jgi:ABC-2 type transport system permease protein
MLKEIFLFEIRYHLRQPLFHLAALALFLAALGLVSSDLGVALTHVPGSVDRNAPFVIVNTMTFMSLVGLFVVTAFVASSALRDFEQGTEAFFFSRPVKQRDYLTGRFAGSMTVSLLLFLALALGIAAGSVAPWQDGARVGPFALSPYIYGLLVMVLPNLLMMGALFFAVAIWSRRLLVTYLCVVVFIGLQDFSQGFVADFENSTVSALLEPSGLVALDETARYWTVAEHNTRLPPVTGDLLFNRLAWLGVGFLFLVFSCARFSTTHPARGRRRGEGTGLSGAPGAADEGRRRAAPEETSAPEEPARPVVARLPRPAVRFTGSTVWHQLVRQTRFETAEVLKSTPFVILLVLGVMFVVSFAWIIGDYRGTSVYPTTHWMLEAIHKSSMMILVIVVVLYSGELIWRERSLKISDVTDALPVAGPVFLGAKFLTLALVAVIFNLVGVAATMGVQLCRGYTDFEPSLYAGGFLLITIPFVLLAVPALFLQVLARSKFLGFLLILLFLGLRFALTKLGFEHNLYRFGGSPPYLHSDMNGFGPCLEPSVWFHTYWGFGGVIFFLLTSLLWVRGRESSVACRLAAARARWRGPVRVCFAVAFLGFVATGTWIFYNTNILNDYTTRDSLNEKQADYEKKYAACRSVPLPRITKVEADVAIYPEERRVEISGRYVIENRGSEPIETLPLTIAPKSTLGILPVIGGVTFHGVDLPGHRMKVADERLGFYVCEFAEPLAPGESVDLGFSVTVHHSGFRNRRMEILVASKGTFFTNRSYLPILGFCPDNVLLDPKERRKYGLPPAERTAPLDDVAARGTNYLSGDWVDFEATLSTSADQIAIAPGRLEREWTAGGRRYFRYRSDAPIVNLLCFISAPYEVVRDSWNDVAIELYHHEGHAFNNERFVKAAKMSLDYCTEAFGPFPHRQLRIVEIPGYHGQTAMALAHTIPFSEVWGFTACFEPGDIDHLTFVVAHEIAHQWWNHQVVPADVQGATMVSEALAQYTALMIMEKECGPEMVRHFLKYELDRYLKGRSGEQIEELPLLLVENQMYVHYAKGSLAMYALKECVGEEALNGALRRFLEKNAFRGPPYTTSRELLDCLCEVVPQGREKLIEDLFETITLFDNRAEEATFTEQEDGTFLVKLRTASRKLRADGKGVETAVPIDDLIDIGVFGETRKGGRRREKVLFLEKRRITSDEACFEVPVGERPVRAGIDPYNKLIDRDSGDNVKRVTEASGR